MDYAVRTPCDVMHLIEDLFNLTSVPDNFVQYIQFIATRIIHDG